MTYRTNKRIEPIADPVTKTAAWTGWCDGCDQPIRIGQTIVHAKGSVPGCPGSTTHCVECDKESRLKKASYSPAALLELVEEVIGSQSEPVAVGQRKVAASSGKSLIRIFSKESEW